VRNLEVWFSEVCSGAEVCADGGGGEEGKVDGKGECICNLRMVVGSGGFWASGSVHHASDIMSSAVSAIHDESSPPLHNHHRRQFSIRKSFFRALGVGCRYILCLL